MERVPKAVRAPCAVAFTNILLEIIGYPTKISAWKNLLAFGPSILAKPSRGEQQEIRQISSSRDSVIATIRLLYNLQWGIAIYNLPKTLVIADKKIVGVDWWIGEKH